MLTVSIRFMTIQNLEPELLALTILTNAWLYATVHPEEVATAIRENEADCGSVNLPIDERWKSLQASFTRYNDSFDSAIPLLDWDVLQ